MLLVYGAFVIALLAAGRRSEGARARRVHPGLHRAVPRLLADQRILRTGGPDLLSEHWPGPEFSRALITRLAFGRAATHSATPSAVHESRPSLFDFDHLPRATAAFGEWAVFVGSAGTSS